MGLKARKRMNIIDRWRFTLGFLVSAINFGFWKPQQGDILITSRCSVKCRFCIYSCNMEGKDMSKEDIRSLVKIFAKYKVPYIRILGGEPFLVYDKMIYCLKELRKYYKPHQVTVVTSGYFSTTKEKAIEKLKPLRDLSLNHLTLSYDAMHLESLKEELYENTMEAATELGLHTRLIITCNNKSYQLMPRIEYFIKKYGVSIALLKIFPFGAATKLSEEEVFSENEYYRKFSKKLSYHRGVSRSSKLFHFFYGNLFKNITLCSQYTAFPDGNIYFCCVDIKNALMGNFRKENPEDLFKRVQRSWFSNAKRAIKFFFTTHRNVACPCELCALSIKH